MMLGDFRMVVFLVLTLTIIHHHSISATNDFAYHPEDDYADDPYLEYDQYATGQYPFRQPDVYDDDTPSDQTLNEDTNEDTNMENMRLLDVRNLQISPQTLMLSEDEASNFVTLKLFMGEELDELESLELIFMAPNQYLMYVYMSDPPTKLDTGEYMYSADMSVPRWLVSDGPQYIYYYALTDLRTGQLQYYSGGSTFSFDVRGARVDEDVPELVSLQPPQPPYVINQTCRMTDGGGAQPWRCVNENITVTLKAGVSGLASLAGAAVITGSHLTLRNLDSPALQQVTLFLDETNRLEAHADHTRNDDDGVGVGGGAQQYGVRLALPLYATNGRWQISLVHLVNQAGRVFRQTEIDLAAKVGGAPLILVNNVNNVTYMAEDLFDYQDLKALEQAEADHYAEDEEHDESSY